jgi:hypothetical protein
MSPLSLLASACPNCATSTVVRANVLAQDFWSRLLVLGLPVLVVSLVGLFVYGIGRDRTARGTMGHE